MSEKKEIRDDSEATGAAQLPLMKLYKAGERRKPVGGGKLSLGCIKLEVTIKRPSEDVNLSVGDLSLEFTSGIQAKNKFGNCLCIDGISVQELGEISYGESTLSVYTEASGLNLAHSST